MKHGLVLHEVDDETLAVTASRKQFWKAVDVELGLSCKDTVEGQTLATLARRCGCCRGLVPTMINSEVVAFRAYPSMEPYNTKFIIVAFNDIVQLDWAVWDILQNCFLDDDVTLWSVHTLCDKLGFTLATTVGDKVSMEVVVERLHAWRQTSSHERTRNKETDYSVVCRNRNETYNYYRLCAIFFETLGDYCMVRIFGQHGGKFHLVISCLFEI